MKPSSLLSSALFAASACTVAAKRNWDVKVGKDSQLRFDPETISASKGDTVTYHFYGKNHSIAQSDFHDPCHPAQNGGFFSAFVPNADASVASATTFTITINDTAAIWVYCSQYSDHHCRNGMVHAINPPKKGNTFADFKRGAGRASTTSSPPTGGIHVGGIRKVHVEVGPNGTFTYSPNNIMGPPTTVVEFSFNAKNHSVVQSSFQDPCHNISRGFSSGFVPTTQSPSGALFDIVVKDTKPVWFYCAQTTKDHCQSGMVGAINAPLTGNTLEAFKELAKNAPTSTIPAEAPIGGIFKANGTVISSFNGDVFDGTMGMHSGSVSNVPPPGSKMSPYMVSMAGGAQPSTYGWANTISDNTTDYLQLIEFFDNVLLDVLYGGYHNLTAGPWKNQYPKSITDTFQSMAAQATVQRTTSTDCLQHYKKDVMAVCKYSYPIHDVEDFVQVALILMLLELGILLDITAQAAKTDSWLIPLLGANLGSKSRMTAVINMIQDHTAATTPREVMMPAGLAYSYVMTHYVVPESCPSKMNWVAQLPTLTIVSTSKDTSKRTISITITLESSISNKPDLYVAFIGPLGNAVSSPLSSKGSGQWTAIVPKTLYGHCWAVLTKGEATTLEAISSTAVAGPEIVWVTDTQEST